MSSTTKMKESQKKSRAIKRCYLLVKTTYVFLPVLAPVVEIKSKDISSQKITAFSVLVKVKRNRRGRSASIKIMTEQSGRVNTD